MQVKVHNEVAKQVKEVSFRALVDNSSLEINYWIIINLTMFALRSTSHLIIGRFWHYVAIVKGV